MEHKGTVTIETERLILRRFTVEDAEAAFKNWTSSGNVTKYLTWKTHSDVSVTRATFGKWVEQYGDIKYYSWAIELKELGEPIGSISAVDMNEDIQSVKIGYCIGEAWWHCGYMSEALSALIDFFFNEVKVNRIEARHDPRNPNSGKVMQKCGMKYEGTLRQADRNNTGICDTCVYGILAGQYKISNINNSDIEREMYEKAVDLIERRYPKGWGGAGVVHTENGNFYTSVSIETANSSAILCIETGAMLEAHKYNERVTHCLCLVRDDENSPFKVLSPCGICQERLRFWGEGVRCAVTTEDGSLMFVTLGELQPHHWTKAYPEDELEKFGG